MTDKPTPQHVIYVGRGETSDKKSTVQWLPIGLLDVCKTIDDVDDNASSFTMKPRDLPPSVGTIYVVDGILNDVGRIVSAIPRWKFDPDANAKRHVNHEWIAVWEARSETFRVAERARKLHDQIIKDEKLPKLLRSLRLKYASTDRIGKLALEVVVLDIIRNG